MGKPMEQPWHPLLKIEIVNTYSKEDLLGQIEIIQNGLKLCIARTESILFNEEVGN